MASKTSFSSSSTDSDAAPETAASALDLPNLENDLVTTPEDVEALRRIRREDRRRYSLERLEELQLPEWLAGPPRRSTSEGWEPFEL